ncbi:MAG: 16S rRNA (uracil(1498)-N(3))-methyltransferase, partial [Clostridia bacterium]|nr:16S rRNA (uracil(1498)-N(3))-methyltransferase [Clostridia bacterium]
MFNFFAKESADINGRFHINGSDHNHIKNVLRMKQGDEFLISFDGNSHLCVLESIDESTAVAKIICENYQSTELPVHIHLF